MSQPARLTSDLLARKGQAFPTGSSTSAGFNGALPLPSRVRPRSGGPARVPPAEPATPREEQSQPAPRRDARLTVRLDPTRHARLKIFAARTRRTGQQIMVEALDAYLRSCGPECECMRGGDGGN